MKENIKKFINKLGYNISRFSGEEIDLDLLSGKNNVLVAGPFLGEFGWELMQWQGYVRQLSKFYQQTIVYGRSSSAFFYNDFASEFRICEVDSWDTNGYTLDGFDYLQWVDDLGIKCDILVADNRCESLPKLFNQDFVNFGEFDSGNEYDLIIHARKIPSLKGNPDKDLRNWSTEYWDELCFALPDLKIGAVGVPELSYLPPKCIDLRGVETKKLCSIMASSKCCIGPSSGVMHLASLCKTPHFVWTSKDATWGFGGTAYRYLRSWNPFATPVKILVFDGYQPKPELIRAEMIKFIGDKYQNYGIISVL